MSAGLTASLCQYNDGKVDGGPEMPGNNSLQLIQDIALTRFRIPSQSRWALWEISVADMRIR